MDRFQRIEASRKRRQPIPEPTVSKRSKPPRKTPTPTAQPKPFTLPAGSWLVRRVNDDGRIEVVRERLSADAADKLAGQMRDRMPDAEVGAGWNYLPHKPQMAKPR